MLSLAPVSFGKIQGWFVDFQKKAHNYEMPADDAEFTGIYDGDKLVGYFITRLHTSNAVLEITQGYLNKEGRHRKYHIEAMQLLEDKARDCGVKGIILQSSRTLRAYSEFMKHIGFKPERIIFAKRI